MQAFADVHDTAAKDAPGEAGVAWIVHACPSQRSANVRGASSSPTAIQAFADVHDTPLRSPVGKPWTDGLGVDWIVQV